MTGSYLSPSVRRKYRLHSRAWHRILQTFLAAGGLLIFNVPLSSDSLQVSISATKVSDSVQFDNITQAAGIHFVHYKGSNGTSTILEEAGPGVCVADYDGDGWQDVYFVNGRDLYKR